jgi:hypothetical protein
MQLAARQLTDRCRPKNSPASQTRCSTCWRTSRTPPSACPVRPPSAALRRRRTDASAASIYLKNRVSKGWSPAEEFSQAKPIPEEEKQAFKSRLVPVLVASQPNVRAQLIPTLQKVLAYDFPLKWPDFLDITIQLLNAGDVASVFAGVQCLLAICKIYRFKSGENRADFEKIVALSFPQLLSLGNGLANETSLEAGEILRTVLKVYKHAIYVRLQPLRPCGTSANGT